MERAIGDERAVYERWHRSADACLTASQFKSLALEEVGCARAGDDPRPLPAPAQVDCAAGTYFFVREDGHVSGCRPTCTPSEACDDGSTCSSVGSAAGGPAHEAFCE